eukprot:Gregarina_sp_Poly_1__3141@NODE_188_length_11674_cov_170_092100_g167_i0_p4_GENE_NODE_188_length_11674_cov_170_092100_g167_i0NODE_188_length_11674_cov_170_092100_g167_i0_p4_ORF_typecomplete_len165_score19_21_NODE_188_length_11674_cov_170_092100_g167_i01046410958
MFEVVWGSQSWTMLSIYIIVLFVGIKLFEAFLPSFVARKLTHIGAGVVFALLPLNLSWRSKTLIAAFSAFVIWRASLSKLKQEKKKDDVNQQSAGRWDLGIILFAIVVNVAAWGGLPYRYLAPLFFSDPAAALAGAAWRQWSGSVPLSTGKKTVIMPSSLFIQN